MSAAGLHSSLVLSYNLRYFRSMTGETQAHVAEKVGIALRTYSEMESGHANPTLHSLELLAEHFKVSASCFLKLNAIRLSGTEEDFMKKVRASFIDSDFGFLIRDYHGMARWGNRLISRLAKVDMTSAPLDLSAMMSETAYNMSKVQIDAEKNGLVQPYLNFHVNDKGETIYFRIYPVLIFPSVGTKPLYSAIYMMPTSSDSQKNYYEFCKILLNCI